MNQQDTFRYDVFISYAPADAEWAEDWLRPRLEAAGLQVCTDNDFERGVPRLINIERATRNSRQTLLVLTPAWVESEWSEFVALLSQSSDPAARQRRLLPLKLHQCKLPARIAMLTNIDLTRVDKRDKEVQRVVKVVRGELRLPERPLSQEQRNRSRILEKVKIIWIKGVLDKSLYNEVLIALNMEERPDAVVRPWDMLLREHDQSNRMLPPGTKIIDVFDECGGELLILGAPGSGKTTILLELARDLITRAEQDDTLPIPLIFNLFSWSDKECPIAEWLVGEMSKYYDIPEKMGRNLIDNNQMAPLMDGLDEVKRPNRNDCLNSINLFRQERPINIVISSRFNDYDLLKNRAKLTNAIRIQPLTDTQIRSFLDNAGDQLISLQNVLYYDFGLRNFARTPLVLSIMSIAYASRSANALASANSNDERYKILFNAYTDRMFVHRFYSYSDTQCSKDRTISWLVWLARMLLSSSGMYFLIEDLQPSCLEYDSQRSDHNSIVYLVVFVLFWLLTWLPLFTLTDRSIGTEISFIMALVLIYPIWYGISKEEIHCNKNIKWHWSNKESRYAKTIAGGIGTGIPGFFAVYMVDGLYRGLAGGTLMFLLGGLSTWIWYGLYPDIPETTNKPNQGVWRSAKNASVWGFIVGLLMGLLFEAIITLSSTEPGIALGVGLDIGIAMGTILGLRIGGIACIQHIILRLILWRNGSIPWNYARFLDYCADRIFLRKVGGGYIFIHRMLMEYFASLDTEEASKKTT